MILLAGDEDPVGRTRGERTERKGAVMAQSPIQIVRYPNRRFYARDQSRYVSLQEIEEKVKGGDNVEIRDSQTNEDLTRSVLTRIIVDRRPDMIRLFPSDMLHFILRSNEVMADFLKDYFQHSLTYLDYLHRHGTTALRLSQPMHWVKAWLDGITHRGGTPPTGETGAGETGDEMARLALRVAELEAEVERLRAENAHERNGREVK